MTDANIKFSERILGRGGEFFVYVGMAWKDEVSLAILPIGHFEHLTTSQSHNAQGNIDSPQLGQICFFSITSNFTSVSQ